MIRLSRSLTTMRTSIMAKSSMRLSVLGPATTTQMLLLADECSPRTVQQQQQQQQYYPQQPTVLGTLSCRYFSSTKDESKTTESSTETPDDSNNNTAATGEAEAKVDEVKADAEEVVEQVEALSREEQLEQQVKSLKDQLLRSLAEQENTRTIARRDVDAAKQYAIKSFAKSLLEVSDNLSRAMESVPPEFRQIKTDETESSSASSSTTTTSSATREQQVLATLYEGIDMTERGLIKAFEMNGLVKFGKVGDVFDPNQHEALYEYVDPTKKPGTIGQVMKSGFFLNKRVLRPAEVGVIKEG